MSFLNCCCLYKWCLFLLETKWKVFFVLTYKTHSRKWAAWMRANTAPGWQEHWGWDNWKDSHFGSKDGRCWGLSGSLCSVSTQDQCLEVVTKVLTCIPEIRAQGSCFQVQLPVGLEQLVGSGARPAQQKGDKTSPFSHLAKAGKMWRCMGPSVPPCHWWKILGVHWQNLLFQINVLHVFWSSPCSKMFFLMKSRPAEWCSCKRVIHFESCGRNLCSSEAALNFCCLLL